MADEKHGSAVRDSDGVKPASVQIFYAICFTSRGLTSRDQRERFLKKERSYEPRPEGAVLKRFLKKERSYEPRPFAAGN